MTTLIKAAKETSVVSCVGIHLGTRSCDAMYHARESKSKSELFYGLFIELFVIFCHKHMFEWSLKLLLLIPKLVHAFQVLK